VANPNFFILMPSSMLFVAALRRSDCLNRVLRALIPMAEIERRLAGIEHLRLTRRALTTVDE
jgi:hypothetical protein